MRDDSKKVVWIRTSMIQEIFTEVTHRKGGMLCLEKCYCPQESFWSMLVLSVLYRTVHPECEIL